MKPEEERTYRNNQIALMLGLQPCNSPYKGAFTVDSSTFNSTFYVGQMEDESWYIHPIYDSDWNWLMQAVVFINATHNMGNKHRDLTYTIQYLMTGGYFYSELVPRRFLSNTTDLFLAVSDFAIQYNGTHKTE